MTTTTLLVRQDKLSEARLARAEDAPLAPGQVRVRVDSFAFTSNNITYAAFGEAMNYWKFFPSTEAGWGIVPVWGFATVTQSQHPDVAEGERLWGYWPMADSAVLQADRVTPAGLVDAAEHRRELHPIYNQYSRSAVDPFHTAATGDIESLLRPLFVTSWLIDDFLADNDFFGARTVMLSSASSKTAYGTAFMLSQREGIQVIGLTSASNRAFCESLGCYSRVLAYEELDRLPADLPLVYVDFAGSAKLRHDIHARFTKLAYSCSVGGTHVAELGGMKGLAGPKAVLFFAPAQAKKRQTEWGGAEFGKRLAQGWQSFVRRVGDPSAPWIAVNTHRGPDAVHAVYLQVLAGRSDPREGHILSFA